MRIMNPFISLVARVPARVQIKLLVAFLAIATLLIIVGAVGLRVLSEVNERTEELIKLQRKIEAYRQVQHDTTSQLYSVSTALALADEHTLSSTLRQLNQFGYDVDRLEFVAKDEAELILHERHHRRQHGAGRRAHRKNEGHGDYLAAEICERDRRAVLRG